MNTRQIFISLVVIQVLVISVSFGILYSMEIREQNSADYVNISGKNRMFTALLLHEMDEFTSGKIPFSAVSLMFDEFHDNIKLLKNGGVFLGKSITPLSNNFTEDIELIEKKFFELKEIANELNEHKKSQTIPDSDFHLKHERIENELIDASSALTQKLNFNFNDGIQEKRTLEIILPIINAIVYIMTIYVIFKTLKKENLKSQKLQKLSVVGQMASRLAHDLKNPLTVIKSSLDMIELDDAPKSEVSKTMVDRIKNSTNDISTIIDDVLEFARTKELNKSKTSILKILNNTLSRLEIPETIKLDLPKNDVELICDEEKMMAIFVNLFTNSFYAMENNGTLSVKLQSTNDKIEISVIDTGSGIPEDILPMIFEPLFSSKPSGTGLGLGICKNIVEQHRGKISVKNNPTTFTITLPKY